jgi:hypothetical protein
MKNKTAEYGTMTVEKALSLARDLMYGPLPNPNDPTPSVEEAIGIIREERRTCGFNWITGEAAEKVLCERQKRGSP